MERSQCQKLKPRRPGFTLFDQGGDSPLTPPQTVRFLPPFEWISLLPACGTLQLINRKAPRRAQL